MLQQILSPHKMILALILLGGGLISEVESASIRGTVPVPEAAQRRVASRYPGQAGGTGRIQESFSTVVFIEEEASFADGETWGMQPMVISQQDLRFQPSLLVIPVGATVSFPNLDNEFHNVFSYSRTKRFDLGRYPQGESKTVTFDRKGIVKIYCEIHEFMRAAVIVMPHPYYAIADKSGRFIIEDVPAGRYTLVVWNMDSGLNRRTVVVPESNPSDISIDLTLRHENGEMEVSEDPLIRYLPVSGGHSGCCASGQVVETCK